MMMYRHRPDEPPRTAALSRRVTVLTGIAVAVFAVVFLRLWYLQVLSGDDFREQANDNRVSEVRVQAPRGNIVDRDGKILVANRTQLALYVQPRDLPKPGTDQRSAVMRGLEPITGETAREMEAEITRVREESPQSPVILAQGLGTGKIFFFRENRDRFPGVTVERVFTRDYRQGDIAAHLFGNVGEVTAEQLDLPRYGGLEQGDAVGQSGIEYEYDRFLRGRPGADRFQVDALGRPTGQLGSERAAAGENVRLTIDSDLQALADGALGSFGLPGAYVAMDVENGEILAMGSAPTFDPEIFTKSITEAQYKSLVSRKNDAPLANRATQGLYPTGSIFKPITALAALKNDLIAPGDIIVDDGLYTAPGDSATEFKNAQDAVFGPIDMSDALKVSSDVYFYELGYKLNRQDPSDDSSPPITGRGGYLQEAAGELGLGEQTGIDLPAEGDGIVPYPAWRNRLMRDKLTDRPWLAGDNINLSVGQGDLQADPLQMATAYAAIGNGGRVVTPHLAQSVETVTGEVLEEIRPADKRTVEVPEEARSTILAGLERAAMEEDGTSYGVFGNFPVSVAGKTGTAEKGFYESGLPVPDQAWYAALAPADDPEVVVVVTIERGGFGADSAAPVAARILEKYFKLPITPAIAVDSKTPVE